MTIFHLPDLGEGLAEAEIHAWHIKEGDQVTQDQPIVSVETAKALVDVPAPRPGKIIKLYGKAGDIIPTHAPLVEFAEAEVVRRDGGTVVGNLEESEIILAPAVHASQKTQEITTKKNIKAMPAARALAKELQIDLNNIIATGPDGQITLADVKNSKKLTGENINKNIIEPLRGVRRQMALTMAQSQREVVAATIIDDADVTNAPTDFTAFLLTAIATAAQSVPELNVLYDSEKMQRTLFKQVNIGLAIDSPDGLFVPVIKDVANKNAEQLRNEIVELKKAVIDRKLTQQDFQDATISLSNFGVFAGKYATPVIVPPAVAILGCGKMRDLPVVLDNQVVIRRMAPLSLTFDHRAVTGGEASRFLSAIIKFLETVA